MKRIIFWGIFTIVAFSLFFYFLLEPKIHYGGDIIEYYGISESFINHLSFKLTSFDKTKLIEKFGKGYFENPEYYPANSQGNRYSSHFFAYSVLQVPVRLFLRLFNMEELKTFRLTNIIVLFACAFFLMKNYILSYWKRILFIILLFGSPLMFFIVWPGPELIATCCILMAVFLFFNNRKKEAFLFSLFPAWQSQPLMFISLGITASIFIDMLTSKQFSIKNVLILLCLNILIFTPNIYYLAIYGNLSPFTVTKIVSMGNFTFQKVIEVIIDPNIGLLFYAPVLVIGAVYALFHKRFKKITNILFLFSFLLPLFFFPLINNWNHGTAGYGPTRYALYLIPLCIYLILTLFDKKKLMMGLIVLYIITQSYILSFNNGLMPTFENTFQHTPFAKLLLQYAPNLYNPTPEIFFERTFGKEYPVIVTSAYKHNGKCKKAYILPTQKDILVKLCGSIPTDLVFINEFAKPQAITQKVLTAEATLYPADKSCAYDYTPTLEKPYICMKTLEDVTKYTQIEDEDRWIKVKNSFGAWTLKWAKPIEISIPPGYIVHYYSLDGRYINY